MIWRDPNPVAEMPTQAQRVEEMSERKFGKGGHVLEASKHLAGETIRRKEFQHYVDLARTHAPPGPWLDLGCGTGVLMQCAEGAGQAIEGIELTPDRREATSRLVKGHIYDQPLELLDLPSASYAAIFMINVFSHLVRPSIIVAEDSPGAAPRRCSGGAYQRDRRRGSALAQVGLGARRPPPLLGQPYRGALWASVRLHRGGARTGREPTRLLRERFAPAGGSAARKS